MCVCLFVCVCNEIPHIDGHSRSRVDASAVNDLTGRDVSICRGELEDFLRKVKLRPVYFNDKGVTTNSIFRRTEHSWGICIIFYLPLIL